MVAKKTVLFFSITQLVSTVKDAVQDTINLQIIQQTRRMFAIVSIIVCSSESESVDILPAHSRKKQILIHLTVYSFCDPRALLPQNLELQAF